MKQKTTLKSVISTLIITFLLPFVAVAEPNIALNTATQSEFMKGDVAITVDGKFAPEGARWDDPASIVSEKDNRASVTLTLGQQKTFMAIALQADWNDSYIIEISTEPNIWDKLTYVPKMGYTAGLRTRAFELNAPTTANQVRVRGGTGDGIISIAEFQLFSELPANWNELKNRPLDKFSASWIPFFTVSRIDRLKEITISLGLLCAFWLIIAPHTHARMRKRFLLVLAGIAFCLWCNFFQFHYQNIIHRHEFFHYYLGSKYNKELSYSRLYECATIADVESGYLAPSDDRSIRNLITNRMESSKPLLENPQRCKSHFSATQWDSFKHDVSWFRENMEKDDYKRIYGDHGFNATPVWSILGTFISKITDTTLTQLSLIGLLDVALMLGTWIIVIRTFGVEAGSLAMIFWGCNFIARFAWTGCGFLRADWIITSLLGLCAFKSKRDFLGGFLLAYAGLLRIFPFALAGGIFLKLATAVIVDKNTAQIKAHKKFLSGFFTGLASLIILATYNGGGLQVWDDFIFNTSKHFNTSSTNMMGLRSAMGVSPGSFSEDIKDPLLKDSFADWAAIKERLYNQRKPFFAVLCVATLIFFGALSYRVESWQMAILALGVISLIRLSNYDYYFLSFFALLIPTFTWPSLFLMMTGLWSWHFPQMFGEEDKGYFSLTMLTVAFFVSAYCAVAFKVFGKEKSSLTDTGES